MHARTLDNPQRNYEPCKENCGKKRSALNALSGFIQTQPEPANLVVLIEQFELFSLWKRKW